ncbi:M23 family metallopeptidase [Patescibacteria group bacterium]|nr:M23 family metallopeptidase [Patescibacteria group bacterium]MBU1457858.1 M23 family metallopeptidase [Patescibacteria group bacterium]
MRPKFRKKLPWALGLVILALIPTLVAVAQENQEWLNFPVSGAGRCGASFGGNNPLGGHPFHNAVDGACGMGGSPIQAVADGTLVWNNWWPAGTQPNGHGITAVVYHPQSGLYTYYAHMSEANSAFDIDSQVKQGDVLGWVGHTGYMTIINDHLHFAVRTIGPKNTSCWNTSCWLNPDNYLGTVAMTAPNTTPKENDNINLGTVGLDITIITNSSAVEVQPTLASLDPTPTTEAIFQQPETITVQLPNPKNPQAAQFILSWVMLAGLLMASGMLAFGSSSQTRIMGIILLIALILISYWLYEQDFRPAFKLPATMALATAPTPTEERLAPRAETVSSITDVVLSGLPDVNQIASVAPSGECNGQLFAQLLAGSAYANTTPPAKRQNALNTALSRITPELQAVYATAERETGVPCEVLAGIHFVEANNRTNGSLISGRTVGAAEPDRGGKVYTSLLETAIDAGNILKAKAGGEITSIEQLISALSRYNGGGNANCNGSYPYTIPYTGCPKTFGGEDDPYAMNWLDGQHSTMYLLYCADYTACVPQVFKRPGSFTVALWFHKSTSR